MTHAKSLRTIGQSLQAARVASFKVVKAGQNYLVQTDALAPVDERVLRNALRENVQFASDFFCFTPADISRLDSKWQKHRHPHSSLQTQVSTSLSQLLRTLGDHLDRYGAASFHVRWTDACIAVDCRLPDGQSESRSFTPGKLVELGLHTRFRRTSPGGSSTPQTRP